jgi:membrane fusion protein (multidrug efflux system)
MKKLIIPTILSIALFAACSGNKGSNKQAELDKLKGEQTKLTEKIEKLEKEIVADGGTVANQREKNVAITEVSKQAFTHYLDIQGKVDADENVTLSPKMPGTISRIIVKTGDHVSNGQILAEMDNQSVKLSIAEAQTGIDFLTTLYNKQKALWDQKIGSEVQFLKAKNAKESAERKMASLNEQLDMTRIKSPINGTVDEVMIKLGQAVAPGAPSLRVVNFSVLKAKADVAEAYASKIHKGSDVIVRFPDINKEIKAKISFSGRAINALNRTFGVEVNLQGNNDDYHPNMLAVLKIADYQNASTVVIPVNTVQSSEEGQYVMIAVKEGGKTVAKKQVITIGSTYDGSAEVKSGLAKGDNLITTGYQDLNQGDVVKF